MPTELADGAQSVSSQKSLEERLAFLEGRVNELSVQHAGSRENQGLQRAPTDKANGTAATSTIDAGSSTRVHVVISYWDKDRSERRDREPSQPAETNPSKGYSCVLRKKTNDEEPKGGEIEIWDSRLLILLRKLLADHWHQDLLGEKATLHSPYILLIHNWDKLLQESERTVTNDDESFSRRVLQDLLSTLITSGSGDPRVDSYLKSRGSLQKQESITFEHLWVLFSPGDLVYGQIFPNQHQLFIFVEEFRPSDSDEEESFASSESFFMTCWTYDFTGNDFRRKAITLSIEAFQGVKEVASLPYRPWSSIEESKRLEYWGELLKRGELFRKYCISGKGDNERKDGEMYRYSGNAYVDKYGMRGIQPLDDRSLDRLYRLRRLARESGRVYTGAPQKDLPISKSDVIIDHESYIRHGPDEVQIGKYRLTDGENSMSQHKIFKSHYDGSGLSSNEKWEELQTALCPPRVLAYILKEKCWAQLLVDYVDDMDGEEKSDTTVMNEGGLYLQDGERVKELLLSLVRKHVTGAIRQDDKTFEFQDIVPDKGKGLVILLYGMPGTGKTSTAQMIARATRKPLFPIGVADIGTQAPQVESTLEIIFALATRWRSILLIDEADVYLQNRSAGVTTSPEKSALVSVFMRVLEYYTGVMFLTTNQIAQFDVAVQSRINIAIKYDPLTPEQTQKIFMWFINFYRDEGKVKMDDNIEAYGKDYLLAEKLDGRQIRNLVTTAIGHALGKGQDKMGVEELKNVLYFVKLFKTDLAGQMHEWKRRQDRAGLDAYGT